MADIKLIGSDLPTIPWQEKPADCTAPVWRYSENPIIGRNPLPDVARIFNSAVMPYEDESSAANSATVSPTSTLAGAGTLSTGSLTPRKYRLPTKTANPLCPYTPMTPAL